MLLDVPAERSPQTVARWFGAMQSQDVASGHWSLGSRGTGLTQADVIDAFERAELVRAMPVLTRSEALACISDAGVDASGQRGYHLLLHAAQRGVACIGPQRGTDQKFVAVADWAPSQVKMPRDEALAELLLRYVRSHRPVSLRDFAGWSGLTLTDAKRAAVGNDGRLAPLSFAVEEMWATVEIEPLARITKAAHTKVDASFA